MGLVLLLIFIPALLVLSTIVLDRTGYCVATIVPGTATLETGPYVQNVSATSASILWRSLSSEPASMEYRASGDSAYKTVELEPAEIHIAKLEDLQPGTTYEYRVPLPLETVEHTFTTAPMATESVVFGVIGDSGTASAEQFTIADLLVEADLDLLLHTGDVVYRRGALCHYGPKYFDPYEDLIPSVPVFPVLGNHDYKANDGRAWFQTFDNPANNPIASEAYYSFDYGPVHVIALDSEAWDRESDAAVLAQVEWLTADLAATELPWTIVTLHRPLWSTSSGDKANEEIREQLSPIFENFDVDIVFSGHAHNYQRINPINDVTYIVTGGGGAKLYAVDPDAQTAFAAKEHHFVRVEANPDLLTAVVVNKDGIEIDRFSLTK